MPIRPDDLLTGGALQGAVAASLLRQHERDAVLAPGDLVGVYRIQRELARGGMAIVYLAERADDEYRQQVALKWMREVRTDGLAAALFLRERQALADLRHPHIARLLDGGRTAQGRPWLVMEYIDGAFIDRHCQSNGLSTAERLQLFLQVCAAAAYAHARGVLHRDIKPGNVLVDADGSARLLDFGIAWLTGQDDLAACAHTPGFASPEQVRGETLTVASDVFQLGCLLAAVLDPRGAASPATVAETGSLPVVGREAIAAGPSLRVPPVDRDLQAIIARACADEPDQRYATADAMADDVRAHLAGRPVTARARTPLYVAGRFIGRHRLASLAAALTLAVIVVGTAYFMVRLKNERDAAGYQARVATSVLDFLRDDLLAAASPDIGMGRELSVREALDLAADNVGHRFDGAKVEQATIRTTLAHLYHRLGLLEQAENQSRHALTLLGDETSTADSRLDAQAALANVLLDRGQHEQAEALALDLRHQWRARHGDGHREALRAEFLLAWIQRLRGDYEAASQAYADIAGRARVQLGEDDMLLLDAQLQGAEALQMRGEHDQALALLLPVHEHYLRILGERHPQTLLAAHSIGVLKRHQGRSEDAAQWLRDTVSARRRVLGDSHPATVNSLNELATVLQDLQRYEQAEPLFREALETRLSVLGEAHPHTRNSMSNLGLLYSLWGRTAQALPLYERTLAIDRRLGGDGHPDTLASMHNLAGLYRAQSRHDDALALHDAVIASARGNASLGPSAWQTGMFLVGKARTLDAAGRRDEALQVMDEGIAVLEASLGVQHVRAQRARDMREQIRDVGGAVVSSP